MRRPEWRDWPLELTSHAENRMELRGIAEIELRWMLAVQPGIGHTPLPAGG